MLKAREEHEEQERGEFGKLLRYTLTGFAGGLLAATVLDHLGFQRSGLGQWLVRTLSGEGESVFEGFYALQARLRRAEASMAEAYGRGKFLGMTAPWVIDLTSRLLGVNVYGLEGFYIPFFYAMSDQIGANVSGLAFLRRKEGSWGRAFRHYLAHPVMLASWAIILAAPLGLFLARLLGFSPGTQVLTAAETIAANLCWLPPVVGWLSEKRSQGPKKDSA